MRKARVRIGVLAALIGLGYGAFRGAGCAVFQAHPLGKTSAPYGFAELVPDQAGPRPLLLVLHGVSGSGPGSAPLTAVDRPPMRTLAWRKLLGRPSVVLEEGALIVAPQSPGEWDPEKLDQFVTWLLANRPIDPERVYLTGPSMGGCGTWRYAAAHPERLAAAMPVCGSCPATGALADGLKTLPIRAFHAWDDEVVPNAFSATWVATIAQLRGAAAVEPMKSYPRETDATFDGTTLEWKPGSEAPGNLSLTEYWTGGHGIFNRVYDDEASWRWLLAQRRSKN